MTVLAADLAPAVVSILAAAGVPLAGEYSPTGRSSYPLVAGRLFAEPPADDTYATRYPSEWRAGLLLAPRVTGDERGNGPAQAASRSIASTLLTQIETAIGTLAGDRLGVYPPSPEAASLTASAAEVLAEAPTALRALLGWDWVGPASEAASARWERGERHHHRFSTYAAAAAIGAVHPELVRFGAHD